MFFVADIFSVGRNDIKYKKKGYSEIKIGIGISWGSSLMIKSGYKGSGINEVVWLGKLVGEAAALCSHGNREGYDKEMQVSNNFYNKLNDENKKLLCKNQFRNCYHGDVVNYLMDKWVQENG